MELSSHAPKRICAQDQSHGCKRPSSPMTGCPNPQPERACRAGSLPEGGLLGGRSWVSAGELTIQHEITLDSGQSCRTSALRLVRGKYASE